MKHFYIIIRNDYTEETHQFDFLKYLIEKYEEMRVDLTSFEEYRDFVDIMAQELWRQELSFIPHDFYSEGYVSEFSVIRQVRMNIDVITNIFIDEINAEGVLVY